MRLGYLDLGDGAGISASLEDEVLTLSGSLDAGGLADAFGPRAQLASMRSGLILPLYAEEDDRFGMTELDGLYELGQVGFEYSPGMPWAMTLRRLAAGSVLGETSVMSAMFPTLSPVVFATVRARVGVPGNVDAYGPSTAADGAGSLIEGVHGRVQVLAASSGPRWVAWSCQPPEFLAGSPRLEVADDMGTWWPLHGKAPRGVPARVSNGSIGLQLPSGGGSWNIFDFNADGTTAATHSLVLSDDDGLYHDVAWSLEVVRADSEMVWVRAVQPRFANDPISTPDRLPDAMRSEVVMRRGLGAAWVHHSRADVTIRPQTGAITNETDAGGTNVVGFAINGANMRVMGQKVVTVVNTPGNRSMGKVGFWRVEKGTVNYQSRAWADPHVTVLR